MDFIILFSCVFKYCFVFLEFLDGIFKKKNGSFKVLDKNLNVFRLVL